MRGEQEQQGPQRSDVLPNADGTSYLRVSLDVEASEASGLSCPVRHSRTSSSTGVRKNWSPAGMGIGGS